MSDPELPGFIVDCMLGRLARWLRILGFDTWYFRKIADDRLLRLHATSGRVLLTRDTGLILRVETGERLFVESDDWKDQLRQVTRTLGLRVADERILTRCILCNDPLRAVPREAVRGRVPDHVASVNTEFRTCPSCGKVYWSGTHPQRMRRVLEGLGAREAPPTDGKETRGS